MPPPSQPQPSPGPPPASPPSNQRECFCIARLLRRAAGQTIPESYPKSFPNEPDQAGSASRHQRKPCPLRLRGTATLGCAPFLLSPHLSQPPAANPDAPVSPGKPLPHTAQTGCWPPLPYENYNRYTSSGRTAPARKSQSSSSHKNSSTPPPQSRHF